MKKLLLVFISGLMILDFSGCARLRLFSQKKVPKSPEKIPSSYSGPKAHIAVADFEIKAAKANNEIGAGLRDMLVNALVETNRYSILGRQELLENEGQKTGNEEAQIGKITKADLIVTATVVEFEPQASGGSEGVGGGGGSVNGNFGGLLGETLNKAHLTLDICIVSASTSEIIAKSSVQGQATDFKEQNNSEAAGRLTLDKRLSAYSNTPMENAIQKSIIDGVNYINQTISPEYYKYQGEYHGKT